MFGLLEMEALEGEIVHGFPAKRFGAIFCEGFDVLESALIGASGLGEVAVGERDAFEFGFGPLSWVGLAGVDVGFDDTLGALTAPEHPAAMSEIFNEMLLFWVGGLEVRDEGVGKFEEIFESLARDDEVCRGAVVDSGVLIRHGF